MSTATNKQNHRDDADREVFSFTFTLSNIPDDHEQVANALFEAGCDDALLHSSNGGVYLDFDREANSMWEAIDGALQMVENCGLGIRVTHVAPPDANTIEDFNAWLRVRDKGFVKAKN